MNLIHIVIILRPIVKAVYKTSVLTIVLRKILKIEELYKLFLAKTKTMIIVLRTASNYGS